MSVIENLGLISGDSHVNEPRKLWSDNLPPSLRSRALQGIKPGSEGGNWELVLEGERLGATAEDEPDRMKLADPEFRYEIMREEGIAGEAIFPSVGLYVWALPDAEIVAASCRVYNEWIADGLARSPRFKCAGLIPTSDVDAAIREVEWVAEAGLGAHMMPATVTPEYNHAQWDRLWAAVEATGLPVVIHQGTGHSMYFYKGRGAGVSNLIATQSMGARATAVLTNAGVLANHPDLHFVFVEYNIGWLAWVMDTLDFYTESFRKYGVTGEGKQWINPELPESPSFYVRRQIHATFQDDAVGIHNVPLTGAGALMWGSDYPHEEGTYPHSRDTVTRLAKGVDSDDDIARIFRTNAAEIFNFSDDVINTPL